MAFEVTTLRPYYEQWLTEHESRTGVGISGIDQRRFRGAIRFLESFERVNTWMCLSAQPM